ncbi:MAG: cytochrome b/b6 domain-containing protein [Sphingobacteriales bacterium]|nr:cytochrome b/b6 domain-containing protein [Sphingobacteriales bacterium]
MQQTIFHEKFSWSLRIWHWLTFVMVSIQIFTVMVGETFLDWQHSNFIINAAATRKGVMLTQEQSREMVMSLRDTIWKWHTYFGYVLIGLFVFRILLEFFQPKEERFTVKFKKGMNAAQNSDDTKNGKHYLLVKFIYAIFYVLMAGIVGTGIWLALNNGNPSARETFGEVRELHETFYHVLLGFLFLHLGGVILNEFGKNKGLISYIFNGGKE